MSNFDKTEITVKDENDEVISHKPAPSKPKGRPAKKEAKVKVEAEVKKEPEPEPDVIPISEGAANELSDLSEDEKKETLEIEKNKKKLYVITTEEFDSARIIMFYQGIAMGVSICFAAELIKKNVIDKFL